MKTFLEHFQKFRAFYTLLTSLTLVLAFSILMPYLIHHFSVKYYVMSIGAIVALLVWKAHLLGFLKIKSPFFIKAFKHSRTKSIAYIITYAIVVLVLVEMHYELHALADIVLSMTISYYISVLVFNKFDKLYIKSTEKLEYFAAKDFEKLKAYLEKYDYFVVGDKTIEDFYSMKINFPSDNAEDVMTFFNFFLSQPKFAFLVANIFKDVKLDKNNNMFINNKLETNPSKVGLYIMNRLSDYSNTEINILEMK